MKVEIPENLKTDIPQTTWGKILSATPVIMAVLSTMLAGLSSSEMTRAQYDRSLAAQEQSKAGDQWSFFQAKRLRGSVQRNSIDLIQSMAQAGPLQEQELLSAVPSASSSASEVSLLVKGALPPIGPAPRLPQQITDATHAVESLQPEPEITAMLAKITDQELTDALKQARDYSQELDKATGPVNRKIDELDAQLVQKAANAKPGEPSLYRNFTLARLRFAALRYEAEARVNQSIANLYELQVRKSNLSAHRHHFRSQKFFYGMLAAQAGVIIATFAMAARKRNVLWSIAAAAGIIALAFAIYVYLYV